jgi:hypothetical protein
MSTRRESWAARRQAMRELAEHPDRREPHEDAIIRYLAGAAAVEAHKGDRSISQPQRTRR